VVQRTRIASQVRWFVHELDPDRVVPSRGLRRQCVLSELQAALSSVDGVVARLARELLDRCAELNRQINQLEAELRRLVQVLAPSLLAIPSCGVLSAAVLIGETAGVHRFRNRMPMPGSPVLHRFRCGPALAPARSVSTAAATERPTVLST